MTMKCPLDDVINSGQRTGKSLKWRSDEITDKETILDIFEEKDESVSTKKSSRKDKIKTVKISSRERGNPKRIVFECESCFEDFFECPLTRDFEIEDFLKVDFDDRNGKSLSPEQNDFPCVEGRDFLFHEKWTVTVQVLRLLSFTTSLPRLCLC